MRKQTKLWTIKDGSKIRICDMSDSHLDNTLKLLKKVTDTETRNAISAGYSLLSTINGEMAEYAIEGELSSLEESGLDPSELFPLYENLLNEKERRKEDE